MRNIVKETLSGLILLTENTRRKLADVNRKLARAEITKSLDIDKQLLIRQAEIAKEIANTKDDKGKPVYSNEDARSNELTDRLSKDDAYLKLADEFLKLKERIADLKHDQDIITAEIRTMDYTIRESLVRLERGE